MKAKDKRKSTIETGLVRRRLIPHEAMVLSIMLLFASGVMPARGQGTNSAMAIEHFIQGGLYDAQNDPLNAIKEYLQAAQYDSTSSNIYSALAVDYYQMAQRNEALIYAQKAIALDSTTTDANLVLAKCLRDMGRDQEARNIFERVIILDQDNVEAHFALAQLAEKLKDEEAILRELEAITRLVPRSAEFHFRLAETYQKRGMPNKALIEFQKVLEDYPTSLRARIGLAEIYGQQRQWDKAVLQYREILDLKPNNETGFRQRLGQVFMFLNRWDEAITEFRILLDEDNTTPRVWIDLSNALRRDGQLDEAISVLYDGMKAIPQSADLHGGLGVLLLEQNKLDQAALAFQEAISIDEGDTGSWINLSLTYRRQERKDEALNSHIGSHSDL